MFEKPSVLGISVGNHPHTFGLCCVGFVDLFQICLRPEVFVGTIYSFLDLDLDLGGGLRFLEHKFMKQRLDEGLIHCILKLQFGFRCIL